MKEIEGGQYWPSAKSAEGGPMIGLLIEQLNDSRFSQTWSGVAAAAQAQGLNVICFPAGALQQESDFQGNMDRVLCDMISTKRLGGLITSYWWESRQWFKRVCDRYAPLPLVMIGREYTGYHSVTVDYSQGMRECLRHLIEEHGCRRIAYLGGTPSSPAEKMWFQTYLDMLKEFGIPFDEDLIIPGSEHEPPDERHGTVAMSSLLNTRNLIPGKDFEAIITYDNEIAFGVLKTLHRYGFRVPHDIALIAFGNRIESSLTSPPLSVIATPYYELGYAAADMLMALLRQKPVPEHLSLPAKLIIRRSCGCLDPAVAQSAARNTRQAGEHRTGITEHQRTAIIAEMRHVAGHAWESLPQWPEQWLAAVLNEITRTSSESSKTFLAMLEETLSHLIHVEGHVEPCHNVISRLRQVLLPHCSWNEQQRLNDLCFQGQVLVSKMSIWAYMRRQTHIEQQTSILQEIGRKLISTFEIEGVMDVLAHGLPRLHIPACYLAAYDDPQAPSDWSELLFAYNEHGRLDADGQHFPSQDLIPDTLFPISRRFSMVMEPLYFGDTQIGFVLFESGPHNEKVYEVLRGEISNALQGARLVQQVREHAAEIAQQQYILDTFMDTVPDQIYFKDRRGRIIRANRAHAMQLGFNSPDEEIGKTDFDFFPENDARVKSEQEHTIMQSDQPLINMEEHTLWPDGRRD